MPKLPNNPALMASNLAFTRSISPSPALLTAFDSTNPQQSAQPVLLQNVKGRGAFLNSYLDKNGNEDAEFDPSKPNVVEGDIANLPPNCDSFRMDYSVNVTAGSLAPNSCEIRTLEQLIHDITEAYAKHGGYHILAARYVWRMLNGSTMWRNYTISANKKVMITYGYPDRAKQTVTAQCRDLPKTKFPGLDALKAAVPNVEDLVNQFSKALAVDGDPLILHVTATGTVGYGGEVYPSQVFSENARGSKAKSTKELVSYNLGSGQRQGMINGPKIGNAIRHIDEWHGSDQEDAIAVEAYGFVQHSLSALRPTDGSNFYNLLWQRSLEFPAMITKSASGEKIAGDIHYFMAMLIRGGVFTAPPGSSDIKPKKSKKSPDELVET